MSKLWLIGGGAALAALLVASIIVALVEGDVEFEPGSPEAAVQTFLRAVGDDDLETAYGMLNNDLQEQCTLEEFAGGPRMFGSDIGDRRLTLESTRTVGDTVFVDVRVTEFHGVRPFGTSDYSFDQQFALRMTDGRWRFTQYPWPFYQCLKPVPAEPARPAPTAVVPTPEPEAP
ncbi:MAG: hypothetical protein O3A47_07430 [Chloroflexi bacterium]|nr:hypothetical protein [Chloroflexota bacterium]